LSTNPELWKKLYYSESEQRSVWLVLRSENPDWKQEYARSFGLFIKRERDRPKILFQYALNSYLLYTPSSIIALFTPLENIIDNARSVI